MRPCATLALLAVAGLALAGCVSTAQAEDRDAFSLGVQGHGRTEVADVGLPLYAGAVRHVDGQDDKSAVSFGAWAGGFGLQIHAMKFRVDASPARVAAFYAKALGRYGEVLDCRDPAARVKPPKDDERLRCESAPKAGDFEYRVGTARSFRVVSIRADGEASRFDMARIDLRF